MLTRITLLSTLFICSIVYSTLGQCSFNSAQFAAAAGSPYNEGPCTLTLNDGITGDIIWNGGDLIINNDLNILNGGSLTINGGTITMGNNGNINIADGGQIDVNAGTNGAEALIGDDADAWTINGVLNISGAARTVNANDGDVLVDGTNAVLTVLNGGYFYCADDLEIINNGTLDVQTGGTLEVGDNIRNNQNSIANPGSPANFYIDGTVISGTAPDGEGTSIFFLTNAVIHSSTGSVDVDAIQNDVGTEFEDCDGAGPCDASSTPLPVVLVSFIVSSDGHQASLEWVTASEINNEGFYVEKSSDGVEFAELGFVPGNGTTNEQQNYAFSDVSFSGRSYYRLRQVDYDGAFEYSDTRVLVPFGAHGPSIYPNPSNGQVRIQTNSSEKFSLSLVSISGHQMLLSQQLSLPEAEIQLNQLLPGLEKGLYIVRFISGSAAYEQRLILQ